MGDVYREGRTILFVSHNLGAVSNLCTVGICLDQGRIINQGEIGSIVNLYIKQNMESSKIESRRWKHIGTGEAQITSVRVLDSRGNPCTAFAMGETNGDSALRSPTVSFTLLFMKSAWVFGLLELGAELCWTT
jgi:lipopolysaccharide transport system ATP-binding protein